MAAITVEKWKNKKPEEKNFEELAIMLSALIDYVNALDARLTAHGI